MPSWAEISNSAIQLDGMKNPLPRLDLRQIYDRFDAPVTGLDCGEKCAWYNPSGKPFCCDICQAVPAAYRQEWDYLRGHTNLWHAWRGDECPDDAAGTTDLRAETPDQMILLACLGPARCQREYRVVSCRQFPFFPYVTADYRFLGLTYDWEFEAACWVISNLGAVSEAYRGEFVRTYDELLGLLPDELDSYAARSEEMREEFARRRRRIPILHRNGGYYLLSPASERLEKAPAERFPRFGPYVISE
jgi:hypothetical protein